jgi:SAM-dependent methyltransferase
VLPSTYRFRSESDEPAPARLVEVDDRLTADAALRQVRAGAWLLHGGDFHNARQLLAAMGRRLARARGPAAATPAEAFRAERRQRALEHATLGRVLVALDEPYRLRLGRAPDVARACREVWGEAQGVTVVPLKTLLGMLGAAEWRKKGLPVPGLEGALTPHYGVYLPTRTDYVELLAEVKDVRGAGVLDVGTGTGVLSFVLLQRGAAHAVGTDVDVRALACATENAARLGLSERFGAVEANLFPESGGRFDLIVSNPPWIPEPPRNRVDRAVFDEGGRFLEGLLQGAAAHLAPGGRVLLLLSDLAVLLGLREAGWMKGALERAGLTLRERKDTPARHGRAKDAADPLHQARSREVTTLYVLESRC